MFHRNLLINFASKIDFRKERQLWGHRFKFVKSCESFKLIILNMNSKKKYQYDILYTKKEMNLKSTLSSSLPCHQHLEAPITTTAHTLIVCPALLPRYFSSFNNDTKQQSVIYLQWGPVVVLFFCYCVWPVV